MGADSLVQTPTPNLGAKKIIMAKKDPNDLSVEERLKTLYQMQTALSAIDEKRALRGELPLEVQDLEDEIEGLTTRIDKIQRDID